MKKAARRRPHGQIIERLRSDLDPAVSSVLLDELMPVLVALEGAGKICDAGARSDLLQHLGRQENRVVSVVGIDQDLEDGAVFHTGELVGVRADLDHPVIG